MRTAAVLDQLAGPVRPGRRHGLWRQVPLSLKVVLFALFALEALYVLGANAFLSFGGVSKALSGTDEVELTYRRAWTVWPGVVHVRDLRLTYQDHNLQWSLDLPRAKVCVRLSELPRRTFFASCVRGEGLAFRLRHRVNPEDAKRPAVAALPPIPPFASPPVYEAYVPEPPPTNEDDLWAIHLEGVEVVARELWVQQFRYLGQGTARGAFELRAGRSVWVGPGSLELEPGRLLAGDVPVAEAFRGRIDCNVDFHDIDVPVGRDVLRYISSELHLHGRGVRLDAAALFMGPHPPLRVASGPGTLELDANIRRGVIDPASQLVLDSDYIRLERPPYAVRLKHPRLELTAGPDERGEAVLKAAAASLEHHSRRGSGATAGPLSIELVSSSVDTTADWSLLHGLVQAPDLEIAHLGWFSDLAKRGSARASLLARYASERVRLDIGGELQQLELELKGCASAGLSQGTFRAYLEQDADRRQLSFAIQGRQADFRSDPRPGQGFQASLEQAALKGDWQANGDAIEGSLDLAVRAARGRIGKSPLAGDLKAKFDVKALDLERRQARGAGRVSIRNAALQAGSNQTKGWWADVDVNSAELSLGREFDARVAFAARLRDGGPVLSLLAAEDELPSWLPKVLPEHKLEASGLFRRHCSVIDFQVREGGGPLNARGRVLSTPGDTRAAFLIRLHDTPLSAGLSTGNGNDGVTPLAGNDWLRKHLKTLETRADELYQQPCVQAQTAQANTDCDQ